MKTTSKKGSKKPKVKRRASSSAESIAKLKQTIAAQARQIREGLEQQTATSEILRMIARSPAELQSVMDTIAENAARLCDADDVLMWRIDDRVLQLTSHFGSIPTVHALGERERHATDRDTPAGRAVLDRQTIHVYDLLAAQDDFPRAKALGIAMGVRTALATPLLRDGMPLGVIHIRRREVRPFTDRQIKLLETFADQAVIAIENVRLFQELTEALEQQTATSEILGVIASSPTELQPVLDAVAENAARVCSADDAMIRLVHGNQLPMLAHHGSITPDESERPIDRNSVAGRAVVD